MINSAIEQLNIQQSLWSGCSVGTEQTSVLSLLLLSLHVLGAISAEDVKAAPKGLGLLVWTVLVDYPWTGIPSYLLNVQLKKKIKQLCCSAFLADLGQWVSPALLLSLLQNSGFNLQMMLTVSHLTNLFSVSQRDCSWKSPSRNGVIRNSSYWRGWACHRQLPHHLPSEGRRSKQRVHYRDRFRDKPRIPED